MQQIYVFSAWENMFLSCEQLKVVQERSLANKVNNRRCYVEYL